MADLDRIKKNVAKMVSQQAPEADIDGYISSEGVTVDDVRNYRSSPVAAKSGQHLSFEEGQRRLAAESGSGQIGAGLSGMIEGVPVIGPAMLGGVQRAAAGISSLINGDGYDQNLKEAQAITNAAKTANPGTNLAGQIAGGVGSVIPLGSTAIGARALGIEGPSLLARLGASSLSGGTISAADAAARGGDATTIAGSGAIGTGIGAAVPVLGAGISAGLRGLGAAAYPTVNALARPAAEAERRLGTALNRDQAIAGPNFNGWVAADDATAASNNIPVINADRGGETTRALARSVANQSPEARGILENTASDRFSGQGSRAVEFVKKLAGGNADDLAYQDMIQANAKAVNNPAYKAASSSPQAQSIYTPRIQQLMQSPSFREAIESVPTRSADRGAVQGFKEIGNPFSMNSQGQYVLKQKADGTLVSPNLDFWNQVKINLDSKIGPAKRAGDNALVSDLQGLKSALVDELDGIVPLYKNARTGAAGFFQAEDALDAGRNFARQPRTIPEATKAFNQFSDAQKKAFQTGYASELIDKIKTAGDRTNVINSTFKNQAAREQIELVFGPQKAKELEAYVRVESLVDALRGSLGNSTTARQLVELGIGAGGGYGITGDWKGAIGGAAAAKGARYIGQRADAQVMERIAKLLTQDNPAALQVAAQQAARNPAYMGAIERLSNAVAAPARAGAVTAIPSMTNQR